MSIADTPIPERRLPRLETRARTGELVRSVRPELIALVVAALLLNLWGLDKNGWANEYYSAAVRSMSTSWHDFFYGSFDASGVMTVDKPPLALWVQALSVRVFGFSSLSMLIPQALMGAASVALLYDLVRRPFGRLAGFAAGLVLVTTPITVAVSRHNNPDALLVLCLVAALWFTVRAFEDGRTRWLVWAGVMVGLGFETKMGAALLIVPGIALAWLWVAPQGRPAALRQLLAGGLAMVAVGLAWPLLMWLTPASSRPWIAGTSDNSIWSLITGYNGLGRVAGQSGGPGGVGGGPGGGGGGGALFGGQTGPLRLLNATLGGQAGWLLGFAVVAGVAVLVATRLRRSDARTGWLIAVGGAFATTAVVFSFSQGIFHPYYTSALAPFTAALVGAGIAQLARGGLAVRVMAPLAIAAGVVVELAILSDNPGQLGWLPAVIAAAALGTIAVLAWTGEQRVRRVALSVALGVLLVAPATWAVQTLGHATNGTFPAGGPSVTTGFGPGGGGLRGGGGFRGFGGGAPPAMPGGGMPGGGMPGGGMPGGGGAAGGGNMFRGNTQTLTQALDYAKAHGGGTVAVSSQSSAAPLILTSNGDVAALGGFSGRESQVTSAWLAQEIRDGHIKYVLTDSGGGMGRGGMVDGRTGATAVLSKVQSTCNATSVAGLYDCSASAAALAAVSAP